MVYYGFLSNVTEAASERVCLLERSSACSNDKSYLGVGLIVCIYLNLWLIYRECWSYYSVPISPEHHLRGLAVSIWENSHKFNALTIFMCLEQQCVLYPTMQRSSTRPFICVCQSLSGVCTVLYVSAVWAVICCVNNINFILLSCYSQTALHHNTSELRW